jgi:hypothetical protein
MAGLMDTAKTLLNLSIGGAGTLYHFFGKNTRSDRLKFHVLLFALFAWQFLAVGALSGHVTNIVQLSGLKGSVLQQLD